VYVADLTEEVVYTSEMALKWITKGESKAMLCFLKTFIKAFLIKATS
jgi:hypothetical protein